VARARRGDLSGPVLAILVTLVLLAIGAAIIAYFTLFAGGTTEQPVLAISGQPVAHRSGSGPSYDAVVVVTITNTGTATVNLGSGTELHIPALGTSATLGSSPSISPGASRTLTFTFSNAWSSISTYKYVTGVLTLKDSGGNSIGALEFTIKVVGVGST